MKREVRCCGEPVPFCFGLKEPAAPMSFYARYGNDWLGFGTAALWNDAGWGNDPYDR
jgi:hypothetical protein